MHRFLDAAQRGDFDAFDTLLAEDFAKHATHGDAHGAARFKPMAAGASAAFGGLRYTVADLFAAGDRVAPCADAWPARSARRS